MKNGIDTATTLNEQTNRPKDNRGQYPDTEGPGCQPFRKGEIIGFVRHVNGPAAQARPEFTATQYELEELTRLWVRTLLDLDFYCYSTESSGSSEWREIRYAGRRIGRLQEVLGQDSVDRITEEVTGELGERFQGEAWDDFLVGR